MLHARLNTSPTPGRVFAGDLRPEKMISIIVKSMGTLCDRQMSGMTRCDWTHPAEATMISKYFGRQGRE